MSTRKSMKLPIVLAFLFIIIIVYLFATIKQSHVTCDKTNTFDSNIRLQEHIDTTFDGKKITSMDVTKTIILPEKYTRDNSRLNSIQFALEKTLNYLGKHVTYSVRDDRIITRIQVDKNQLILLDNIEFIVNDDIEIKINSNTKSSDVILLKVGDNYTDGEFMKRLKNNGYTCK